MCQYQLTESVRIDFRALVKLGWCSDDSHREYKARLLVGRLELLTESLLEHTLKPLKERCGMELIDGKDGRTWERHQTESGFQSAPQNTPTFPSILTRRERDRVL